jgi:L-ascorbate metabolism protein UlaG (beta-lactamase superfamily)
MQPEIQWLCHASVRVVWHEKIIYFDPWKLKREPKGDIVCISHPHFDHLDLEDVQKVLAPESILVGPADVVSRIETRNKITLAVGEVKECIGFKITGLPAYNLKVHYHPKEKGWLGFLVESEGTSLYFAGDTDFVPELEQVHPTIAILPIGGTYTMDAEEAARAVEIMRPKIAIPVHYGETVGTLQDAEKFAALCAGKAEVQVLKPVYQNTTS